MPAKSKAQQRFMGMVHAVQKGDMEAPSPEVAKVAKDMDDKSAKDFASTKHKGLPNKIKSESIDKLKEIIKIILNLYQPILRLLLDNTDIFVQVSIVVIINYHHLQ